ncbi:MAG: uroporphyrinogen decarboxylase family protein [Proteobacteria bacterium]|nr:uroporphyrinogen decarboxylase family protein [Pseudomonadota bacterium]
MEKATGRHYVVSALKRQYTDRIPTTVLIGPYCSKLTRYTVREILKDAKKSAEAHLAFYDRFHPDSVIVYNDIYLEVEAMGCELEFPEDNISHPRSPLLKEQSQLSGLRVPDPKKDGRLPYFFELCERVSEGVRKTATMGLGHSGPWNLAMHLRGAEQLLIECITDPEFVHELMRFTTEVVRTVGDALIEAGFLPSLGEAFASCSLISPDIYRDFIKPCHKELRDYFKEKRALMALHICGYIDPIIEHVIDTGINFISLDAPSSLKKMVDQSNGRMTIMGNVPTPLFATGTREEMEAAIKSCIETAAAGSGYILSSGCEIPLNSTEDRVEHFFSYAHEAGRDFMSRLGKGG